MSDGRNARNVKNSKPKQQRPGKPLRHDGWHVSVTAVSPPQRRARGVVVVSQAVLRSTRLPFPVSSLWEPPISRILSVARGSSRKQLCLSGAQLRRPALQQLHESIHGESSVPDDRPQCAPVQFAVARDDHLGERFIAAQNDVASFLPLEVEARPLQRSDTLAAGNPRQFAHTATRSA